MPCIACNLCFSRLYYHQPIMCTVSPSLGHEGEEAWGYYGFTPAPQKKKRIGMVGGGPAGLQCAAAAAKKGHEVILWEKDGLPWAGSTLLAAKVDEGDEELLRPVRYLEGECRKAGVTIELNRECSAGDACRLRPGRARYRNGCRLRAAHARPLPRPGRDNSQRQKAGKIGAHPRRRRGGPRHGRLPAPDGRL